MRLAAAGEVLLYDPRKLDQTLGSLACSELGEPVTALSWQQERLSRSQSSGLPSVPQPASRTSSDAAKMHGDAQVGAASHFRCRSRAYACAWEQVYAASLAGAGAGHQF